MGLAVIVILVLLFASYLVGFKVHSLFAHKNNGQRLAISIGASILCFAILFSITGFIVISNVSFSR